MVKGSPVLVAYLLDNGANPLQADRSQNTSLDLARTLGNAEITKIIEVSIEQSLRRLPFVADNESNEDSSSCDEAFERTPDHNKKTSKTATEAKDTVPPLKNPSLKLDMSEFITSETVKDDLDGTVAEIPPHVTSKRLTSIETLGKSDSGTDVDAVAIAIVECDQPPDIKPSRNAARSSILSSPLDSSNVLNNNKDGDVNR